jgi:hypothetical protein
METKILIGIVLITTLIVSIGIVVARGTSGNENEDTMEGMMNDMDEDMIEEMEKMMEDEEFRDEMLEHMGDCPMMKRFS